LHNSFLNREYRRRTAENYYYYY